MEIYETIKKILVQILGVRESKINIETTFADLGADSLDVIRLVVDLEKEYNVSIPDAQVEKFYTIKDVVKYISNARNPAK